MTFTRTSLALALTLSTFACKGSKEEQACRADAQFVVELDPAKGHEPLELTPEALAECVADLHRMKEDLSDAAYATLLDCKIAARDVNEWAACFNALFEAELHDELDDAKAQIDQLQVHARAEAEAAIAKLDAHVGQGIGPETLASLRDPPADVPAARITIVADDARQLIETGRVDAEHPLSIRLQPGLGAETNPVGLEGAELTFVDEASGATIGRVAPLPANQLGAKTKEITALVEWLLEQPESRRVELIATPDDYSGPFTFEPPEILRDVERFERAGLSDRPLIWLDGEPYTVAQWWAR